jgi:hypothetical protein
MIDIDYALKVRTAHVGNMRARGLLGFEDMHLLAAEVRDVPFSLAVSLMCRVVLNATSITITTRWSRVPRSRRSC